MSKCQYGDLSKLESNDEKILTAGCHSCENCDVLQCILSMVDLPFYIIVQLKSRCTLSIFSRMC